MHTTLIEPKISWRKRLKLGFYSLLTIVLINYGLAVYWSLEPEAFDVRTEVVEQTDTPVVGTATVGTLIKITETMLNKPGGFMSNDMLPPSLLMDNMPAWEMGVLTEVRDLTLYLRNEMSRSQSQSPVLKEIKDAESKFRIDRNSWAFPSAESEYEEGIELLQIYLQKLQDAKQGDAQFYARADNLEAWLKVVENNLGSLSQRLTASVGQERINTDLAGDIAATQSTTTQQQSLIKTSWWDIDDVFYEARGECWALIHMLKAVQIDFNEVLKNKAAMTSLQQIIRELEATQETVWSPIILNGGGYGFMANHSLVIASYISRANAAIIDLRNLLEQG